MGTARTSRPVRREVVTSVVGLIGLSIAVRLVLASTAPAGDPFDSPLYPWTWLALPLVAAAASAWRPGAVTPVWSSAALVVPMLVITVVLGTSDDTGLWGVGLFLDLLQGVVVLAVAYLGALVGTLVRRADHRATAVPHPDVPGGPMAGASPRG